MARDLRMNIDADASGARRGLDTAARALNDVARQTREVERSFIAASGAAVVAAKRIDDVGDQARSSAAEAKLLARALDDVGDQARQAGRAMGRIEGPSGKGLLTGLAGEATRTVEKAGAEAATTFASAIEGGIMNAFKALPAEAQAGIAAGVGTAIAVGAPVIASALNAALLLGVGGGGLAAGIALAASNAQVKNAFSGLGQTIMANLREAAKPFEGELVASANIFGKAFRDSLPDIKGIFATLAQAIQPLAAGLAGMVRSALPGIRRAAEAAVPVFRELAREMPRLGTAISDFFSSIADGGPGAVETFRQILILTSGLIKATGGYLEQLSYVAQGWAVINHLMFPFANQTSQLAEIGVSMENVGTSAERTGRSVRQLKIDFDALFGREMDAREAAIAFEQAFDDLTEGFKRGAGALDINNQKGRDNIRLIDDAINRARDKLKADLDAAAGSQTAIDAANAAYQSEIERIREVLRHMGLQESEIDKLIGKANTIPRNITIDVGLVGAGAATGMLNSLGNAISRVIGGGGNVSASASKSMQKRAGGGPVVAGQAYIVGEHRPEIFVPNVNGRILPDAAAMARHGAFASPASTSAAPTLRYNGTPMGLDALFLSWLEKKFRNGDLQFGT
jgi:predicted DNA-binding transcriptional regulator AlpA